MPQFLAVREIGGGEQEQICGQPSTLLVRREMIADNNGVCQSFWGVGIVGKTYFGESCPSNPRGYIRGWLTVSSDVDECSAARSPCEQVCVNEPGSYRCSCREGFTVMTSDPRRCVGRYPVV